jgi:isocitrate dehydrogenase
VPPGSTHERKGDTVKFVVMAGDGIGEEITAATLAVLRAADKRSGLGLEYDEAEIGLKALSPRDLFPGPNALADRSTSTS